MGERGRRVPWPVRSGAVPALAEAFVGREAVPDVAGLLVPGTAVALAQGGAAGGGSPGGAGPCGKTQLASCAAGMLWQSRGVDLLVWVPAPDRASVLSGYVRAAAKLGLDHGGPDVVAARLLAWLAGTARPWLMVLDDLRDGADMAGLWPAGPAGRVLVTAAGPAALAGGTAVREVPVPVFSLREATGFLSARLTEDPDQRNGAIDLAGEAGGEPAVLAMAGAVMAATGLSCREYLHGFTRRRDQLAAAGYGSSPADAAWTLSADLAGQLAPADGTWPLLVLAALLDGTAIPAAVFTAPAVCRYLAGPDAARSRGRVRPGP